MSDETQEFRRRYVVRRDFIGNECVLTAEPRDLHGQSYAVASGRLAGVDVRVNFTV